MLEPVRASELRIHLKKMKAGCRHIIEAVDGLTTSRYSPVLHHPAAASPIDISALRNEMAKLARAIETEEKRLKSWPQIASHLGDHQIHITLQYPETLRNM